MSTDTLTRLAAILRDEDTVISPRVVDPAGEPALGALAAAGPRAARAPDEYAILVESVREGYLLHYGRSRLIGGPSDDLHLLAGDYLYALGLERLAGLGDLDAVRELSDLISLSAQLHADGLGERAASALWLAATVAVASGPPPGHEGAKAALRDGEDAAATVDELRSLASARAAETGIGGALASAAAAIDSAPPSRGHSR